MTDGVGVPSDDSDAEAVFVKLDVCEDVRVCVSVPVRV